MEAGDNKVKISRAKLHDDLVLDILSRLPVKSLLRFKCISKSWLSMISHPQFIKTHLLRSTRSPDCTRLLLKTCQTLGSTSFVSIDPENPDHDSKSLYCPWEIHPWCSSGGLFLVFVFGTSTGMSLVLWNPSIRSFKRIKPPCDFRFCPIYGLCYDSTADDFRVFILKQEDDGTTSVLSYSLRNDTWYVDFTNRYYLTKHRTVVNKTVRYCHYMSKYQAVVNGTVHWVLYSRESDSWVIVYFDLVEGKLKEMPPPSSWKKDDDMNLVVLGEHLCVYCANDVEQIEVYAMREYGKKESWSRLFVIPYAVGRRFPSSTSTYVEPLCLTKEGHVLISIGIGKKKIGIYDTKYRSFSCYESVHGQMPIPYVETLVSLNGGV